MVDPKTEEVKSWLLKSQQDLYSASWLMESPIGLFGAVGFHCQQAVEKALKAYLTWVEVSFEKTHSLIVLVGMCMKSNPVFENLRQAAVTLTPYAVITRYPGDLPDISVDEANTAIELAQKACDLVKSLLPN